MSRLVKWGLISFGIMSFYSCSQEDCEHVDLDKNDLLWFKAYENHTQFIMKSNLGNVDTLMATDFNTSYTACVPYELGPNQYQRRSFVLKSSVLSGEESHCDYISMHFKKYKDSAECEKKFFVFNLGYESKKTNSSEKRIIVTLPVIGDVEAIKIDKNNGYQSCEKLVDYFIWSESYGLIEIGLVTNEIYKFEKFIG